MLLFTATSKYAIRLVELARKRLIGCLDVTGIRNLHQHKQNRKLRSSDRQLTLAGFAHVGGGAVNSNNHGVLQEKVQGTGRKLDGVSLPSLFILPVFYKA